MNIPILAKLSLLFVLYCISDLSIKKQFLKNSINRANKAKRI